MMICGSCAGGDHQCDHDGCACTRCNGLPGDQPLPIVNRGPAVQDLVMADMGVRKAIGIARYGTPLQPHNGRDALRDLYEELLDGCNYIRQLIYERDGR